MEKWKRIGSLGAKTSFTPTAPIPLSNGVAVVSILPRDFFLTDTPRCIAPGMDHKASSYLTAFVYPYEEKKQHNHEIALA